MLYEVITGKSPSSSLSSNEPLNSNSLSEVLSSVVFSSNEPVNANSFSVLSSSSMELLKSVLFSEPESSLKPVNLNSSLLVV